MSNLPACNPNQQIVSWNAEGPQGPPGNDLGGLSCATGEAMTGVDQDGNLVCTPLPGVPVVKDGNGDLIGTVLGTDDILGENPRVSFLTAQKYLTQAYTATGRISSFKTIYYEFPNCLGTSYARFSHPGSVFYAAPGLILYYAPRDAGRETVTVQSHDDTITPGEFRCVNAQATYEDAVLASPNDPQITGVPNTLYGPITIDRQP
jgi:hypothetical protein